MMQFSQEQDGKGLASFLDRSQLKHAKVLYLTVLFPIYLFHSCFSILNRFLSN